MREESQALQLGELRMLEVVSTSNTTQRTRTWPLALAARTSEVPAGAEPIGACAVADASPQVVVDGTSSVCCAEPACDSHGASGVCCAEGGGSEGASGVCYAEGGGDSEGASGVYCAEGGGGSNGASGSCCAEWARGSTGTGEGQFLLLLQLEGTSVHHQGDREATLAPGDFTLCSSTRSSQVDLAPTGRYLVVAIPDTLMRRHLSNPEDAVAVRMSGSCGLTAVLSNFIKTFWTYRTDPIDSVIALRLSYTLLDLIAAAYSVSPHARHESSSLVAAHRVRIIDYIEAHLRDPNLNPTVVARACKITPRYLHHLFTSESETVTQYIQRRRLEECARALIAAPIRTRLVTEIAFDYGFNSLTHFGRVFRHQFGQTPSEYRRASRD